MDCGPAVVLGTDSVESATVVDEEAYEAPAMNLEAGPRRSRLRRYGSGDLFDEFEFRPVGPFEQVFKFCAAICFVGVLPPPKNVPFFFRVYL